MFRAGLPRLAASLAVMAGCVASLPAHAAPDPPPPSEADRTRASALFESARRAFEAGDFLAAAQGFEAAYLAAPHHSASWNAARSWHRAGDLPRAAMLYQRYLREAPFDAPDRDAALAALAEIRPSLGRIVVVAPKATDLTVDGRPLEYDEVWVVPGAHIVEGRFGGTPVATKADVVAGAIVSVALEAPGSAPPPGPTTAPAPTSPRVDAQPRRRDDAGEASGWPAWTILPFAGATLVAAGGLVASGIDTENLHQEFEASGETSGYAYDNGRFAMHRTNAMVAVTAGLGAITLGVALFAIDWNGGASGGRVIGVATPRGLDARGTF